MGRLMLAQGFAALALASTSCEGNQSGHVAADRFGDVSHPAARGDALAGFEEACGPGDLTVEGAAELRRSPYLQRVSDRGAVVLWTTTASEPAAVTLEVTTPDGAAVTQVPASVDDSAGPMGARQVRADVTGLEAATLYCYQPRRAGVALTTRTGFRTAPAPGSGAPVAFAALGDSGSGSSDQLAVEAQLHTVPFDLFLHTGDIAYDDGTRAQLEAYFFDVYAPLLRSIPAFPATGNHDLRTEGGAPFREAFELPANGGPAGTERWYSYDWGDVHFVALDTDAIGAAQAAWLEEDLAHNTRPWTIVYGHRPPYSSGEHGSDGDFRAAFGPILARHRVALVLSGHDHDYERTHAIDGVTYVVTGGGGRGTRPVGSSPFTAFADDVLHFVYVRLEGDTLSVHAIDATGQDFDGVQITRPGAAVASR